MGQKEMGFFVVFLGESREATSILDTLIMWSRGGF